MTLVVNVSRMRVTPITAVAMLIGVVAVLLLAWPWLFPPGNAPELVANVNRAYASAHGYTSSLKLEDKFTSERVTLIRDGKVMGFSDETGTKDLTLSGVATPEGIWIYNRFKSCWMPSGGAEATEGYNFGQGVIPTEGVTFETPHRAGDAWVHP